MASSRRALVGVMSNVKKAMAAQKSLAGSITNPQSHQNVYPRVFAGKEGPTYNLTWAHFCTPASPSTLLYTRDYKEKTGDHSIHEYGNSREGDGGAAAATATATATDDDNANKRRREGYPLSSEETRLLLKHIQVDDFKKKLVSIGTRTQTGGNCIALNDAVRLCKETGAAITDTEAEEVLKKLDDAGVILIFRKRIFLEPHRVAELLAKAIPLQLNHDDEDDPRKQELARLEKEKAEIDRIAEKQVRNTLWMALGAFTAQSALFFRLTFWDLSWDVMEPITFFVTSSSLLVGFFFFVLTNRDPSYRDLMRTLLSSKQKKLMKKRNFNLERLKELQMQHCLPQYEHPHPHHHHASIGHSLPSF